MRKLGTYTASILVGKEHTFHGGIIPTHLLFLSENDVPAWILTEIGDNRSLEKIVWVPTLENMLEDALLMVAIYVLKDREVVGKVENCFKTSLYDHYIELYNHVEEEDRRKLYRLCKRIFRKYELKLTFTVMLGSYILNQIKVLENYPVECEVCITRFARSRNYWGNKKLGEFHEVEPQLK